MKLVFLLLVIVVATGNKVKLKILFKFKFYLKIYLKFLRIKKRIFPFYLFISILKSKLSGKK